MQMISKCLVNTLFQNPTMNYLLMNIIILNSHRCWEDWGLSLLTSTEETTLQNSGDICLETPFEDGWLFVADLKVR